jgi:Iron-containing redox enzyme
MPPRSAPTSLLDTPDVAPAAMIESPDVFEAGLRRAFPTNGAQPDPVVKLRYLGELHRHYIRFFTPPEHSLALGNWDTPVRIARIEAAWNRYEEWRVSAMGAELPSTLAQFREWFRATAVQHEYHGLCDYLRNRATLLDVALFMLAEEKVDGRFDDIIALAQLGASGVTKMTIAANFWDEMGDGDYDLVHTSMFDHSAGWMRDQVVAHHAIDLGMLEFAEVYGNACELLMYGLRRQYLLRSLASIGLLERTAPARFSATVDACRRLGVPQDVVRYQKVHARVDEDHGRDWFDGVFEPIIEKNPLVIPELALGVLIRGNVSAEFYRKVQGVLFGLG